MLTKERTQLQEDDSNHSYRAHQFIKSRSVTVLSVAGLVSTEISCQTRVSSPRRAMITHLLLDLEPIHDGSQLAQDFICLLVVLELSSDQVGQISEWLRRIEDLGTTSVSTNMYPRAISPHSS
jgi:hypothetical protein